MFLCYVDESGTPQIPGNTSHFVLAGLAIPIPEWRACDGAISELKARHGLPEAELHTAWMLRPYLEQARVPGFEALSPSDRRAEVMRLRRQELLRLQRTGNPAHLRQTRKNHRKTEPYIHLTLGERQTLIRRVADTIGGWSSARLFAECIDKVHFDPERHAYTVDEQALDQVVSRFERFLQNTGEAGVHHGLLIHDNNQTVARRHTELMVRFHRAGTQWTQLERIIETPLFVDSQLTSMVQLADLCSFALRRCLENQEEDLLRRIWPRADRIGATVVGVRHFTRQPCGCRICESRGA